MLYVVYEHTLYLTRINTRVDRKKYFFEKKEYFNTRTYFKMLYSYNNQLQIFLRIFHLSILQV